MVENVISACHQQNLLCSSFKIRLWVCSSLYSFIGKRVWIGFELSNQSMLVYTSPAHRLCTNKGHPCVTSESYITTWVELTFYLVTPVDNLDAPPSTMNAWSSCHSVWVAAGSRMRRQRGGESPTVWFQIPILYLNNTCTAFFLFIFSHFCLEYLNVVLFSGCF